MPGLSEGLANYHSNEFTTNLSHGEQEVNVRNAISGTLPILITNVLRSDSHRARNTCSDKNAWSGCCQRKVNSCRSDGTRPASVCIGSERRQISRRVRQVHRVVSGVGVSVGVVGVEGCVQGVAF